MVADLPARARSLIAFVGLDWDDACPRFHENRRAVAPQRRVLGFDVETLAG
jgi:hypothetical protein